MRPKHPYRFAVMTLALGVVYGLVAWYQLRSEEENLGGVFLYGVLAGGLSSLSVLIILALGRTTRIGWYVFAGVTLFIGLIGACSVLAELLFAPSGSKKMGALPVIVTIPLMVNLISPATFKRKSA